MTYATYPHDRFGKTTPEDWSVDIVSRVPAEGSAEWLTFNVRYRGGHEEKLENVPFERGYQVEHLQLWLANRDDEVAISDVKMSNSIEQEAESTEVDQAIRAHLRQACEHKIALRVDAAIDVVDTDPEEADAWAYEAGKEAWEFDLPVPEKLASHPALSAAFKRGFESVDQQSRSQREVANYTGLTQDVLNALASEHRMTPGAISVSSDGTKSVVLERDDVDDRFCQAILTVHSSGAVACHTGLYRGRAIINNGSVTEPSVEVAIANASAVFDDLIVRHAEVRKEENYPSPGM